MMKRKSKDKAEKEGAGYLEPNEKTVSAMNEIKSKKHELDTVKGQEELDKYLSKLK